MASNRVVRGYELQERVGAGGFGEVYRAFQPSVGRQVAIKIILPQYATHPEFIRRFEAEARLIARLEHPHIVPLYDYWREADTGNAYLVMRWLQGGNLYESLQRGPWTPEDAARLVEQIAGALAVAHRQGVIHRDVKPENILLDLEGNAYLSDFGIAKDLQRASAVTAPDAIPGSLLYIAPEMLQGQAVTPQSDQYSLGLVMYEVLTGVHPYADLTPATLLMRVLSDPLPSVRAKCPDLPAALEEVLQRTTAKEPAERYPDTLAFAQAFREAALREAPFREAPFREAPLREAPTGAPGPAAETAEAPVQRPAFLAAKVREEGTERPLFVARERELAQLDEALQLALTDQGRVAFVTGEAGGGKTSLLQEFTRRAQEAHVDLIVSGGNCNAHTGIGDPYLPFREILESLTGDVQAKWAAGAISAERARRLWHMLPLAAQALAETGPDLIDTFVPRAPLLERARTYPHWPGRADLLARLEEHAGRSSSRRRLVGHAPDVATGSSMPGPQQSHLFEQYTRVLQVLAQQRPLLIVLDDLQWADLGSISLLFHLGRQLAGSRILLVGAYRAEEVAMGRDGERHPLESVVHEFQRRLGEITINLGQAESREFVEALLDHEPNRLGGAFREMLYRQTRGHPLFTIELLRGLQERGDLTQDAEGYWVEGAALNWETSPARVEAVIAERIGRVPQPLQAALQVASVEGEVFTAEVIAQALGTDEREMVQRLSGELDRRHRLVRAQAIERLGSRRVSRYRFRHILFQNYLHSSLDQVERAYLHEDVGHALEALYGDQVAEIAVQLGRHFEEAGLVQKAVHYLQVAGERAARLSAHTEAIGHLTRALALLRTLPAAPERDQLELPLQMALGVPLVLTKGHAAPEVERTYARAQALCERIGDAPQSFQVLLGLRRFHFMRGKLPTAYALGEQLLATAQRLGDPTYLSRAHMMQAEALYHLGEYAQALEHAAQGLALYDPQGWRSHTFLFGNDTGIGCQIVRAQASWYLGYPDQARAISQEALDQARAFSHPFTLVFVLYFDGVLQQLCRDADAVREQVQAVLRISAERGFALYLAWGTILQGWALAQGPPERGPGSDVEGHLKEGIGQMREGIAALRAIGAVVTLPSSLASLVQAYGRVGEIGQALDLFDEALELVEENKARCWEAELCRLKGELLLAKGAESQAETSFQRALAVARRQGARSWELRATTSLARLWQGQGRRDQARQVLAAIYGWFTEGFDTPDLKEAKTLLGELSSSSPVQAS
jgi:predicted ATPase